MTSFSDVQPEMADESFVILGTSPLSSMASKDESLNVTNNFADLKISVETISSDTKRSLVKSLVNENPLKIPSLSSVEPTVVDAHMSNSQANSSVLTNTNSTTTVPPNMISQPSSLAASFIMGEINADTLKTSVYSQFPSICSMENCTEEVMKLQGFFNMYQELKNALTKANESMKFIYTKWSHEHEARISKEVYYEKQLQQLHQQIAVLRNENVELQRDIDQKVSTLQINMELREKEHGSLVQQLSEKNAQIKNMSSIIDRLEQRDLASFEYVPKNNKDSKTRPDYIDRGEHERIVKQFEHQMSELAAQNYDLKDIQKQYIDELTCLKVNATAAEELVIQLRSDIALLKSKDIEKSETFSKYESDRDAMRDEIAILRQQIEVYRNDFEIERTARQNLAGEKDQLLQDLRSIQRKNQELIELAQQKLDQSSSSGIKANLSRESYVGNQQEPVRQPLPSTSNGEPTVNKYICPICFKAFEKIATLEDHVNLCLKD